MKEKILKIICGILICAICGTLIWAFIHRGQNHSDALSNDIVQIDLDSIYLVNSGVQVDFSEVILSSYAETRKLIVLTRDATVSTELTDRIIQKLDFDFLKKTQKVSYTGKGYFVVDLDNLTRENIVDDKETKTLTILINHAYLQAIEIDPDKVIIDEVKEGLLARGDIELTVSDYNSIEKELRSRMEEKFNTAENGQMADTVALQMVKEVYAPVIRAIDADYTVNVEFK